MIEKSELQKVNDKLESFYGGVVNHKYMSTKEAMRHLFDGYKITRARWENEEAYIQIGAATCLDIEPEDLTANDWYIVS